MIGFLGAVMTWSKTVLYWLVDYYCGPNGWCATGQNDARTWIVLYAFPNVSQFSYKAQLHPDFNLNNPEVRLYTLILVLIRFIELMVNFLFPVTPPAQTTSLWIIVPFAILVTLGHQVIRELTYANSLRVAAKSN